MNSDEGLHGEASCKEPWALREQKQRGETYSYPKESIPFLACLQNIFSLSDQTLHRVSATCTVRHTGQCDLHGAAHKTRDVHSLKTIVADWQNNRRRKSHQLTPRCL